MMLRCSLVGIVLALALGCSSKDGDIANKKPAADKPEKTIAEKSGGGDTAAQVTDPDPRFPTARAAGSEGIFALEEPDRGPLLTAFTRPGTSGIKPARVGECEIDHHGVECAPGGKLWRVFRIAKSTVYESRSGGRVIKTVVVEVDKEGRTKRMVSIGGDGRVEWSRHYSLQGSRFTARLRSGKNQLSGCGAMSLELDDKGRTASATCLQWLGESMRDQHGVVTTKFTRDKNGLVSKLEYFDKMGQPSSRHDGVHRVEIERDAQGRRKNTASFDSDAKPARDASTGCMQQRTTHDSTGQIAEQQCLAGDGALINGPEGYAADRHTRDARGCAIETSFLGVGGKPVQSRFSAFGVQRVVDELCRPVSETCIDAARKPTKCSNESYATIEYRRDAAGNVTARRYLDAEGAPSRDPEYGIFEVRHTHDDRGRIVSEACFDDTGSAIECPNTGFHAWTDKLDDAGRAASVTFTDADGKPTSNLATFESRNIYDNYDHIVEQQSLGKSGEPIEALGASTRRQLYDDGHRLFAVKLFQTDGQPANYRGCFTSVRCPQMPWHAVRIVRNSSGAVAQNLFFDAGAQLIATIECTSSKCFGIDRDK